MFGLLKRGEKVYVMVVPDCSRESLMPVIKGLILEQSTIYTNGWRAYDDLVLNGYEHYRVFHSENEFARGKIHVNGIENFWSFAKKRQCLTTLLLVVDNDFVQNRRGTAVRLTLLSYAEMRKYAV